MKLNKDKCHLLIAGHKYENLWVAVGGTKVWEENTQTMLGIQIENNLFFDKHVIGLCKGAGRKLSVLKRLARILHFQIRRILIQSFFNSQFSYCPLIWMFINRGTNHRINRLQERSLRILYKDDISAFKELFQQDNSVTIYTRNIKYLLPKCTKYIIINPQILYANYNNFMFHILYISLLLNLTHMTFILTLYISNTFYPKYA